MRSEKEAGDGEVEVDSGMGRTVVSGLRGRVEELELRRGSRW